MVMNEKEGVGMGRVRPVADWRGFVADDVSAENIG